MMKSPFQSCLLIAQLGFLLVGPLSAQDLVEKLTLDGHEVFEGRRILLDQASYPRLGAKIVEGPTLQEKNGKTTITFTLDRMDDVLVRVIDAQGKTVENLGCGVLGSNAPAPFQKNRLRQEIDWPSAATSRKAGHQVQISVGCLPRFDRFIAHDPEQQVKHVCGMEVDHQGRLYVSFFTERRGDTEVRRYDRQGKLLGTVYPPSPESVRGSLADVSRHVEKIDGQPAFPQRRGGWPFFMYKYHSKYEDDPTQYPFPFRVAPNGRAYVAEIVAGRVGLTPEEIDELPAVKARIFKVDLDPFWFLERMSMGSGSWAIGPKGFGYLCSTNAQVANDAHAFKSPSYRNEKFIGNTIIKVSLDTVEPIEDFQYSGTEKLSQKRAYLGTLKTAGEGPNFFNHVRDLTLDQYGTLYVIDENRIKMYRANGQFIDFLDQFESNGKKQSLGDVHGIRAAKDTLYVVGRLDPLTGLSDKDKRRGIEIPKIQSYGKSVLVKFKINEGMIPETICSLNLHGRSNVIAVDNSGSTPIVWVGNGGEACFTRIEDTGQSFENVNHIRGVRKQIIKYPWSVAVDSQGRVYTFDYDRGCLVRTNEDGTDWLESEKYYLDKTKEDLNRSLFVDRKRDRLYRSAANQVVCTDLEFNEIKINLPPLRFAKPVGSVRFDERLARLAHPRAPVRLRRSIPRTNSTGTCGLAKHRWFRIERSDATTLFAIGTNTLEAK